MKRAMIVGAGTVAGAAAVLAYQPGSLLGHPPAALAATAATAASGQATATGDASGDVSGGVSGDAGARASTPSTYTGDAYTTRWGPVQVQATVDNGQLVDVSAVQYPANDQHSYQISAMAIPALAQQAIDAQSANIDGVSGASYTSMAFAQSLQSALVQAGL